MKNTAYEYKHPFTVWENIKADIETGIINGVYGIGDKVPSINQICQDYDVANNTAVKVLESLRNDGTIMKRRGIGYFVKPYANDKLAKKRRSEFENRMFGIIEMAKGMGYDKSDFLSEIDQAWEGGDPHGE